MPIAVSFINMKGGVGKTTLVSQLAFAADRAGFRVLAVDLDPQSNLSHALMGARTWVHHVNQNLPTTVEVMEGYAAATATTAAPSELTANRFPIPITHHWGSWGRLPRLDADLEDPGHGLLELIPSRLELSRLLKSPSGAEQRLATFLASVGSRYDLILIDCAPTESILTQAAYFASRFLVVPIRPSVLATIGLPLLARSVEDFRRSNSDHSLEIAGLVINHPSYYNWGREALDSRGEILTEAERRDWKVFTTELDHSASYPKAAYYGIPLPETSHTRSYIRKQFEAFAAEFFSQVGLRQPSPPHHDSP